MYFFQYIRANNVTDACTAGFEKTKYLFEDVPLLYV
jgi:hypothetical protein